LPTAPRTDRARAITHHGSHLEKARPGPDGFRTKLPKDWGAEVAAQCPVRPSARGGKKSLATAFTHALRRRFPAPFCSRTFVGYYAPARLPAQDREIMVIAFSSRPALPRRRRGLRFLFFPPAHGVSLPAWGLGARNLKAHLDYAGVAATLALSRLRVVAFRRLTTSAPGSRDSELSYARLQIPLSNASRCDVTAALTWLGAAWFLDLSVRLFLIALLRFIPRYPGETACPTVCWSNSCEPSVLRTISSVTE